MTMLAEATNATSNRTDILAALKQASVATGTDFNYLLDTAMRESGLKSAAKAGTSSASGLFQFVEQTWLGLVKQHGGQYGLGSYASQISQGADGRYHVDNAADRSAILSLRNNPQVASVMEGEYANQCRSTLEGALGRDVCNGELYAAHFLGTQAATKLIRMTENQPDANAAKAFPAAADANENVFYHADGTPKTVSEVYAWAMREPSGAKTVMQAAAKPAPVAKNYIPFGGLGKGASLDTNRWQALELLGSMGANTGFSSSSANTPFALTSNVIDVLASLSPAGTDKHAIS
ncbi:MAG: lytic transglycosylase domain-containing protein [Rhizomicrobium sp.]